MSQFCNLCDVSLDLHDGPNTCHIAAEKEFIIGLFHIGVTRPTAPAGGDA